jgi:hypothetical protein
MAEERERERVCMYVCVQSVDFVGYTVVPRPGAGVVAHSHTKGMKEVN